MSVSPGTPANTERLREAVGHAVWGVCKCPTCRHDLEAGHREYVAALAALQAELAAANERAEVAEATLEAEADERGEWAKLLNAATRERDEALTARAMLANALKHVERERDAFKAARLNDVRLLEQRDAALIHASDNRMRAETAEQALEAAHEALREQAECWLEDERGWRQTLAYFEAQNDADRHDAKELIAAIDQRASTVAENARTLIARAALDGGGNAKEPT